MTAATAPLCGHRWQYEEGRFAARHRCDETADHPGPCRCRCGATTTREDR